MARKRLVRDGKKTRKTKYKKDKKEIIKEDRRKRQGKEEINKKETKVKE